MRALRYRERGVDDPAFLGPRPNASVRISETQTLTAADLPPGRLFGAIPDAVVVMDADGLIREWNPAAERMFGHTRAEALGREVAELIVPGPLREAHRNGLKRLLETGDSTIVDRRIEVSALRRENGEFPVELAITRLADREPMFAGFIRDLRPRGDDAEENRRLQQRMAFLAQAGLVLDRSLDYYETLGGLADLTVPELAQLTVIDLLDDDGLVRRAVAAATDAGQARAVEVMRREHPLDPRSLHPVADVLRTARPILLPVMTPDFQRQIAQGADHFALMRRLRYHSAIVVPLVARRRVLGTLSLLRMEDAPSYDSDDLVLAEELARRAALAIDNARLFESTRHLARTLQSGLLPRALPDIPGVRIVGHHRAAAEGQDVGGDFYDAFEIADGRWGIVIGDVCGKGPEAAALTALARHTIRALARDHPAQILNLLNDAILRNTDVTPGRFLTAAVGEVRVEGERLHATFAVGGHPPPLVLRADGQFEQVDVAGPLIGVRRDIEYVPSHLVLGPGDTLVLYTDGLTDAQAPTRILSEHDLVALLRGTPRADPAEIVERLVAGATGGKQPRDDIALLVLAIA